MLQALLFIFGLGLLLVGGRTLVYSAVGIAVHFRVPPLLVALTLVSWGTSCPELAFNLISAVNGRSDLVFGNVIGANMCNLGMVLGGTALIVPLVVHSQVIRVEIPLMVLMFAIVLLTRWPTSILPLPGPWESIILLGAFCLYSIWTIRTGLRNRPSDQPLVEQSEQSSLRPTGRPLWFLFLAFVLGIAMLTLGGQIASDGAAGIARSLGMSERLVGLTIVALGTTSPELVTSLTAAMHKQVDVAVGNAVGSCLFNLGVIFALCGLIAPAQMPPEAIGSILCMTVLGILLIPFSRSFNSRIVRFEGAILLAVQGLFLGYEISRVT